MKGEFHFNHPAFQNVSDECKDLIKNQASIKREVYNYLSKKVTPMNVNALQEALTQMDKDGSGCLPSDQFVRCLSQTHMKLSDREV